MKSSLKAVECQDSVEKTKAELTVEDPTEEEAEKRLAANMVTIEPIVVDCSESLGEAYKELETTIFAGLGIPPGLAGRP